MCSSLQSGISSLSLSFVSHPQVIELRSNSKHNFKIHFFIFFIFSYKLGNDNPPRFPSDRLRFYVPENSPVGTVVGELRATDADEGGNAKIEYTIVGGADMKWFALKPSTGGGASGATQQQSANPTVDGGCSSVALLVTRTEMDYESDKKVYNIIVRASSLPLRNDVEVEIFVTGK